MKRDRGCNLERARDRRGPLRALAAGSALFLLGGCATLPQGAGFEDVQRVAGSPSGQALRWERTEEDRAVIRATVKELLQSPLTSDTAVQVALLNNRGLQGTYEDLGISQADLAQAGRLPNPVFAATRQQNSEVTKTTLGLEFNFLGIVLTPALSRLEGIRFEQTKLSVGNEVLQVAAETRRTYFEALAAEQRTDYYRQVVATTEAAAELAARLARAGNISRRDQGREQVFYAEAVAELARAQQEARASRERLNRLMGLWGSDTQWTLPKTLPDLPKTQPTYANIEALAISQRLDVQARKKEAEALASALGLTRSTRFINVLDLGVETEKETGDPRLTGPTLTLELPIFDFGNARVARYEAQYRQALKRVANTAIDARAEAREAYQALVTAYHTAKHYRDEVVPLRKRIADESVRYYNGMLISVFELLADAREQVTAVNAYIQALRDFWIAQAELTRVVGGRLSDDTEPTAGASTPAPGSAQPTEPANTAAQSPVKGH